MQAIGTPAVVDPISLVLLVVGGALSVKELVTDPLHQKIALDNGIVKTCIAGDLNDLVASLSVPVGAIGSHVVLTILGKSRTFAVVADAGFTVLSELLGLLDFMDRDRLLPGSCKVLIGDADFSLQLVVLSAVIGGGILAQDDDIPSSLFFVEATSSGDDFLIGPIRVDPNRNLQITDMAVWDERVGSLGANVLTHPTLYAVSFDRLYRINRATGAAVELGSLGVATINALAVDRSGNLFAAGLSGDLLLLNRETGAVIKTTRLNPAVVSSGDIVFLPDGRLVGTVQGTSGDDILVEIDPGTGEVRIIGSVEEPRVYGLTFFDGKLWGLTNGGELVTLDLATGRALRVRDLSFRANGSALR